MLVSKKESQEVDERVIAGAFLIGAGVGLASVRKP